MNPLELTRALKGKWHGSYGTARCPAHHDNSPSLAIGIAKNGRTLVKCHAGCTQEAVIDALRRLGLWSGEPSNLRPFTPKSRTENPNGEYALKLWAECRPAQGTSVDSYLRSRGITIPVPDSLRFHPKMKYPEGGTWPAMVALVTDGPTGKPIAIHRTFLKPDGSGKAPVDKPKMMLGPCQGGAVRLAEAGEWLGVGEGIETCLSVMQEMDQPVWAALSTSGLKALGLPAVVREVVLLADRDDAGEEAAKSAASRWRSSPGLKIKIARPTDGCRDFNEMLLKSGGEA
jgi:putative DNA primase/helicase